LTRTHRDAGTLQQFDGEWRLHANAARLVPSAVRTLIDRRAARLPARTRAALGDAAILGRSFSLRDLRAVRATIGDGDSLRSSAIDASPTPAVATADGRDPLADDLVPAVETGLLLAQNPDEPADYTFTHDQVREFAANELTPARRRQVHAAIVDLLTEGGDPDPAGLPMLARHALAAGDTSRAARFSIDAAAAALGANAPEEALRLVQQALPAVSSPEDRRVLLATRDDAFAALRRTDERLDALTELAALAEAMRDPAVELDVQLRRASALRMSHDEGAAAELARRVQSRAAERGDAAMELRAVLELGQALVGSPLGESYGGAAVEIDRDAAEAAYRRAVVLAEELRDDRSLAAALREIGTINYGKARGWFAAEIRAGRANEILAALASGSSIEQMILATPVAPLFIEVNEVLERALALFERLGDRTGVMSTVIAMAYAQYGTVMHLSSSVRHLEEIRRVTNRLSEVVTESERARLDLQMLFGVHVWARAKVVPDSALSRGAEAHRAAKLQGNREIEFLAAGGMALSHLELGDVGEAERWLGLASAAAAMAASRTRSIQLETWRGMVGAAAGDADAMREHLERAVTIATQTGRASARCEALARLGLEAARLVSAGPPDSAPDSALIELVERSAAQVKELLPLLPGHPPWGAQADAALSAVALARGDVSAAVTAGNATFEALQAALHEDVSLEIVLPAARAVLAAGSPEMKEFVRGFLQQTLSRIARGMGDEKIRVAWLSGPVGRELVELVARSEGAAVAEGAAVVGAATGDEASQEAASLSAEDRRLLQLLTEGRTNAEIAADLELDEADVAGRLAHLSARLGASNRAEATSLAFRGLAAVGGR
ncbi:MAG TPA: LuxR C-terminal-related transcriptional regulator, partial [Candidatus Limnocylindrales bacterium]|nr:LuxR C-terminal-related transcriptional regulator [Candidatus Limnocylindrales bacterium]